MKNMKKWSRRLGAMCGAVVLATALAAPAAFADETATAVPAAGAMTSYEGTTYTVTLYSGNQGTFAGGETQRVFSDQVPGEPLSFEGVTLDVPTDSKYYAKGVRLAGLDNERSDKNRDGENLAGAKTPMVAYVSGDGTLVGSVPVTEDADYVVAYGIMANRVAFTVNYVDAADGTELAEPQTFFGDIGDVPATAPVYIENHVPHATLIDIVLSEDEAKNVITYRYTRLAEGTTTEPQPDGTVDTVNPDGSRAEGVHTTTPTHECSPSPRRCRSRPMPVPRCWPMMARPLQLRALRPSMMMRRPLRAAKRPHRALRPVHPLKLPGFPGPWLPPCWPAPLPSFSCEACAGPRKTSLSLRLPRGSAAYWKGRTGFRARPPLCSIPH